MKPRNKAILADALLETEALLSSIIQSDELSEWSRAGVFSAKKNIQLALKNLCPSDLDFIYATCEANPKFFIENFIKIKTPAGKEVKFKLNPLQLDVLDGWTRRNKCFVKKPRQCGLTALSVAYALWCSLFGKDESIAMISTRQDGARLHNDIFRSMYDSIPDYLKLRFVRDNRDIIEFENGNKILFRSQRSLNSFRGHSLTRSFFDEHQFFDDFDELFQTIYPCFRGEPKFYFYSTKNKFFKGTVPACDWVGSYDFTYDKSRDAMWAVNKIREMGIERFQEEFM